VHKKLLQPGCLLAVIIEVPFGCPDVHFVVCLQETHMLHAAFL
jgi:hypothetical protein